jgi:hypothetical protein
MKGTYFKKPLEWNIETIGESWHQGDVLKGALKVKNHGPDKVSLTEAGVALAYAEIKKVQSRTSGVLETDTKIGFSEKEIKPGEELVLDFSFEFSTNGPVTDKKSCYYLAYGIGFTETQLQVRVEPKELFLKTVGLLDTFHRFKLKDYKTTKKGVEFKLLPPGSRELANIESLLLIFAMEEENLIMKFDFQVKRLDTAAPTTKISKESVLVEKSLLQKEYSLGKGMLNQDGLLKKIEEALLEVKMKAVF